MRLTDKSKPLLLGTIVLLAAMLGPVSAAGAEPAALEEYVLTLPGVDTSNVGRAAPLEGLAQRADPTGVTGEAAPTPTPLGAVGSAVISPAGLAIALGVLGLGAVAIMGAVRRRRGDE
ncbi:MAG TPA: hypothetical protein VKA36_02475 [Solirubrobacterales bacterium]|nr:hypothetical protein [Solirubrobacterales bacterium]